MDINKYLEMVKETAVYPSQVDNFELAYLFLGLIGELDEYMSALNTYGTTKLSADKENLIKEAGDLQWYIAGICMELDINLSAIFDYDGKNANKELADVMSVMGYMNHLKKYYRDDKPIDKKQISDVLTKFYFIYVSTQLGVLDIEMSEVMEVNYNKLMARKENGTIKGDGDSR